MKTKDSVNKSWAGGLAQTLFLNVCDAPKAQFGQIVSLALTCPSGTSQTQYPGVCAIRERRDSD